MSELVRVKASAGAGKTYNLSTRYLSLLKRIERENIKSIIAITFTNKAASEMKERILRFLKEVALNKNKNLIEATGIQPQEAETFIETILSKFSDFNVRTIDSLLFSILRALAFELNLRDEIEVIFNQRTIFDIAFDRILDDWKKNKKLIEDSLITFLVHDEKSGFYPEKRLRDRLFELFEKVKGRIVVENPNSQLKTYTKVKGYINILNKLQNEFEAVCKENGVIIGGEGWTRIVAKELENKEIIPLVYAFFGVSLSHFLFDEFQDTSRQQWTTLFPILDEVVSTGGSLFMVGDPKQAIYGWRGGDWKLFEEVKYQLRSAKEFSKNLDYNWRSIKPLVEFFNRLFSPLEDPEFIESFLKKKYKLQRVAKETARDISNSFKGCKQKAKIKVKNKDKEENKAVKIYKITGRKEDTTIAVREKLVELIKTEWENTAGSKHGKSLAVLVRRNEEAEQITQWLFAKGIPVVTENALKIESSRVVKGLLNLLEYIYTESSVGLYGFLSSGIFTYSGKHITEEYLFKLWKEKSIRESLKRELKNLKEEILGLTATHSAYELTIAVIEKFGLWERLEKKEDLFFEKPFVERFLELIHSFEIENGPSVGNFLKFIQNEGLKERVGLPEGVEAVKVMTIYKAKGLEFDIVFVPFTDWGIADLSPIEITEEGYLVQLGKDAQNCNKLSLIREKIFARTLHEHLNLFYVAVTRAKERLYLFLTLPNRPSRKPISLLIDELIKKAGYTNMVELL